MATTSTPIAGTGRRAGLDRDDIVDAALALVEADGAAALTMRKLATTLDVTTNTIYWHVGGRDTIVAALISRLSDRLAEREVQGSEPAERVLSAACNIWDSAVTHRHVTALAHQVGAVSLLELPLEIALVRELEAAGLHGPAARDALRAILMCVAGFLVVALRPDGAVPAEYRSQALWADVTDSGISGATLAALRHRPAMRPLLVTTLGAIVDSFLAASASPEQETP